MSGRKQPNPPAPGAKPPAPPGPPRTTQRSEVSPSDWLDFLLDDLFTNALGEEAERLVLMGRGKKDLGGWNRIAIRQAILRRYPELTDREPRR